MQRCMEKLAFKSTVCQVQTVYREELDNGYTKFFLTISGIAKEFVFASKLNRDYLQEGAIITIHRADKYYCIQEGNHVPPEGYQIVFTPFRRYG